MRYYQVDFATPRNGKKNPKTYHAFYRDRGDYLELKVVKLDEEETYSFKVDAETIPRMEKELSNISVSRGKHGNYLLAIVITKNGSQTKSFGQWLLGEIPNDYQVDHINRNSTDYRLINLRAVTVSENLRNRRGWGKWGKGITRDSQGYFIPKISLGRFETQEEAMMVYTLAAEKLFPAGKGLQ